MVRDARARPGLNTWPEERAAEELESLSAEARRIDVDRAWRLATIAQARHHRLVGCASMGEYGRRLGLRPCVTWDLVRSGLLLQLEPHLEASLLSGELTFASAGRLFDVVGLRDEEPEPWIELALQEPAPDFCARVEEHLESRRIGSPPVRLSVLLSSRGKRRFDEAKALVEQRRQAQVTDGEAVEVIAADYVARAQEPSARPDEGGAGGGGRVSEVHGRHVPAAVRRAVRHRDRDRCRVPGCRRRAPLHFAHVRPHRDGGPATAENLLLLCALHNQMMEHGLLRIDGDAAGARFLDARGAPYVVRAIGPPAGPDP